MVVPKKKKTVTGKAGQKGRTVMPEAAPMEIHQPTVEEQVQEVLQKTLPGVLAQLMPGLVSAAPVQASTSDHSVGAELVDRTDEGTEDDTPFSGAILYHTHAITGKGLADCYSSDDEDNALTYTLRMEKVRKVAQQQYINFSAMFSRRRTYTYCG